MDKLAELSATYTMTDSQKRLDPEQDLVDQRKEFEALFEQHWDKVWAVAYRLVGDADEAQDLALEAFIRLYQSPPSQHENIPGWLYRVTSRLGLNALRSRRRKAHYEALSENPMISEKSGSSPEEDFEVRIERERVRLVLGELKPRSAQILVLRGMGFSYAEIAESLALSPGSIGTLLARAQDEFEKKWRKMTQS